MKTPELPQWAFLPLFFDCLLLLSAGHFSLLWVILLVVLRSFLTSGSVCTVPVGYLPTDRSLLSRLVSAMPGWSGLASQSLKRVVVAWLLSTIGARP